MDNTNRSSVFDVTETSLLSDYPDTENDSVLNSNAAKLMDTNLSVAASEKSMADESSVKLSITLDPSEREHLKNSDRNEIQTSSVMNLTEKSSVTENETMCRDVEMESVATKTLLEDDTAAFDESSVIPVDDDDDDDDDGNDDNDDKEKKEDDKSLERSALQISAVPVEPVLVESEMFSHLQPKILENNKVSLPLPQDQSFIKDDDESDKTDTCIPMENCIEMNEEGEYFRNSFIELGRRLWPSSRKEQCYTKGCLWSPDGTCLLVPVHKDGMHVMELPTDLYTAQEIDEERELNALKSAVHVKEGGMVYDVTWYPFMNSADPAACCWLATRQHEPIHMWDAFTGELRCSYRGYDDVDEVEAAISVAFSNDGQKVVGGYKKSIKIFDTNVPGRVYTSIKVKQTVSCFAFTTENDNCVTTGSWNSHIYHYDLRAPKLGPLFTLDHHKGGVTWLKYSSYNTDNWTLFSGARMDGRILQWDMRNYQEPVKAFERNVETNQRIYFDLSPAQKWLISGDTEGLLRVWDIDGKEDNIELPIHSDCCNGVSFHPFFPILSTCSGQYHFLEKVENKENELINENIVNYENCVMLLWFGGLKP